MNQETLKALTELSNDLGTAAEYLWSVLVKQAQISGFISLFFIFSLTAAVYFLFKFIKRKTDSYKGANPYDDRSFELWTMFSVACVLAFVIICLNISNAAIAFLNPEYWALKQILGK